MPEPQDVSQLIRRTAAILLLMSAIGWLLGIPSEAIAFVYHRHELSVAQGLGRGVDSEIYLIRYYGSLMATRFLAALITFGVSLALYNNSSWLSRFYSVETE